MGFGTKGPAAKKPAASGKQSFRALFECASDQKPLPQVGEYRFEVISCEFTENPKNDNKSFKANLRVVSADANQHAIGSVVQFLTLLSGDSKPFGVARMTEFLAAACGFDSVQEYLKTDPDGFLLSDALDGGGFIGNSVDARVTRGRARDDGDYYREYEWQAAP